MWGNFVFFFGILRHWVHWNWARKYGEVKRDFARDQPATFKTWACSKNRRPSKSKLLFIVSKAIWKDVSESLMKMGYPNFWEPPRAFEPRRMWVDLFLFSWSMGLCTINEECGFWHEPMGFHKQSLLSLSLLLLLLLHQHRLEFESRNISLFFRWFEAQDV